MDRTRDLDEDLRAQGSVVVIQAYSGEFPLKLESLDRADGRWRLLSVADATDEQPERAEVWIADEHRATFLALLESYISEDTKSGAPKHNALVANMGSVRRAILDDLWRSEGEPPRTGPHVWELWLNASEDAEGLLRSWATRRNLVVHRTVTMFSGRIVVLLAAEWNTLSELPFTSVPLAEVRRASLVGSIEDLTREEQHDFVADLAGRITPAPLEAPAVCHLDTGVHGNHDLLAGSLDPGDNQVVPAVGTDTVDRQRHGTLMAGLGLFGDELDAFLASSQPVPLVHRLEAVKILPDAPTSLPPVTYGTVTASAVAMPEVTRPERSRVFCLPITAPSDAAPGRPTLWSASLDALAAGAGIRIDHSRGQLEIIDKPTAEAARLFVVSAGNVAGIDHRAGMDYRDQCDLSPAQDPSQAWNVLSVGASTSITTAPVDPSFASWWPLATAGELSPHSRTGHRFPRTGWPTAPDVVCEGGNYLTNGYDLDDAHPEMGLRTTHPGANDRVSSANATSAATAQVARLGALTLQRYPHFWPETVRGLIPHTARWTPPMRQQIDAEKTLTAKSRVRRRYGWGIPDPAALLNSVDNAVTLVVQDEFIPFTGPDHSAREFRLHRFPWPAAELRALGAARVDLRVTLSYFIEPNASRRGWRGRYAYSSHGLRFKLKRPLEDEAAFVDRINRESRSEEEGRGSTPGSASDRWLFGPQGRDVGSLHQDDWEGGTGPELADMGMLAITPIGGWWKNSKRRDRRDHSIRYSLMLTLSTAQPVDLYAAISTLVSTPIQSVIEVPAT